MVDDKATDEATKLGVEAYIYGYPLVTIEMTRRVIDQCGSRRSSPGSLTSQFSNPMEYPTATFRYVTAPNAATDFTRSLWLDLAVGPHFLSLPDVKDRYYLMPTGCPDAG